MRFDKRARMSYLQLVILFVSVFSFAYIFSIGVASAASDIRQVRLQRAVDNIEIEVVSHGNNLFVDRNGIQYYQNKDGKLEVLSRGTDPSTPADSATSALVPTNNPTGPAANFFDTSQATGISGTGSSGSSSGTDSMAAASQMVGSMGQFGGLIKGPLGEALVWGGVMFGGAMAVTSVLGGSQNMVEAISIAAGVGAFTAKIVQGYFNTSTITTIAIGAGVGFLVYVLIYKEEKYEAVEFRCLPWQAPIGANADICETCNDETMPCSDYRCRSLGQTCELVNPGTSEEMCVDVNPKDVTPPIIQPDPNELTVGYTYANVDMSPPGPGFDIHRIGGENECVEAFTPLRFGITSNEPAQCKIDFNSTTSFDSMYSWMGGSNLFKYEHYEQFVLPYAQDFGNTTLRLENGKDLTFFIRCRDKRGNTNEAEYSVNFCIDPSPDTTAPRLMMTSMDDGGCIPATTESAVVEFYTNEPSECRWSRDDQDYDLMKNFMQCTTELYQINALQLYTCRANLTGVSRDLTDFYVRCRDQPNEPNVNDRNTNQESFRFSLRGSNQLKLREVGPNGTIPGGINPMPVDLTAETLFGCDKGLANCFFSGNGIDGDYILFANTNQEDGLHNQTLYLGPGEHEYFIKCVDSGGNLIVNSTKFFLDIDTSAPIIARIYNDDGQLKIVTLRDSECSYSYDNCDFLFDEGTMMPKDNSKVHFAEWNNEKTYYIKCRDKYRDLTADCSAIVKPTKLFYESTS